MADINVSKNSKSFTTETISINNVNFKNNETNSKKSHVDIGSIIKVTSYDNPDTIPTMFTGSVTDIKGSLLILDHTNKAATPSVEKYGRINYDNGNLKLDNSIIITASNANDILGPLNILTEAGDTTIVNTDDNAKISIDSQGANSDVEIKAADDITLNPSDSLILTSNKLIHTPDTITVGSNGGEITATAGGGTTHNPVRAHIYLKVTAGSTASNYIWDMSSYTGSSGQVLHLFFDNSNVSGATLRVNFSSLMVGSGGSNTSLVFNGSGQSTSLIYLDSKWRVFNSGAGVV